jgi:hypothetical protein
VGQLRLSLAKEKAKNLGGGTHLNYLLYFFIFFNCFYSPSLGQTAYHSTWHRAKLLIFFCFSFLFAASHFVLRLLNHIPHLRDRRHMEHIPRKMPKISTPSYKLHVKAMFRPCMLNDACTNPILCTTESHI